MIVQMNCGNIGFVVNHSEGSLCLFAGRYNSVTNSQTNFKFYAVGCTKRRSCYDFGEFTISKIVAILKIYFEQGDSD